MWLPSPFPEVLALEDGRELIQPITLALPHFHCQALFVPLETCEQQWRFDHVN
jgi:hypothetical protein